jgi:flagellar protein FliS
MTAYAQASRAYTESSVLTAPPERLVVMLYDGAGRFLARAAAAIRAGEQGAAGEPLGRAQAILHELLATLDPSAGEVTERLQSIYLFCERTLVEAQLQRDADKVERVAELLAELRDAWAQIAEQPQRQHSALGELSA